MHELQQLGVPTLGVQRKADHDGVMPGAGAAVERAAASSGHELPPVLRSRFEGSLGADLGNVRVHTGADSEQAAAAVGARAYAVGQDIHFGRGQYQPGSDAGARLLAHEVAHTVQQGAGSRLGAQFKLEVSAPHDPAEHEADAAADAMMSGAAARVSTGVGLARATLQREVAEDATETDFSKSRDAGWFAAQSTEDQVKSEGEKHGFGDTTGHLGTSNVEDRAQAVTYINLIGAETAMLGESGEQGKLDNNLAALGVLKEYVNATADQNFAQGLFGIELDHLAIDSARLKAMFHQHWAEHGVKELLSADGTTAAKQVVTAGTGKSTSDAEGLANGMQAQGVSTDPVRNSKLQHCKEKISALQHQLAGYGPAMSVAAESVMATTKVMRAHVGECRLPPVTRDATPEQLAANAEIAGVQNDLSSAVTTISAVGTIVKTAAASAGGETKVICDQASSSVSLYEARTNLARAALRKDGEAVDKADVATSAAKVFTDYDARLAAAQGKASALKSAEAQRAAAVALQHLAASGAMVKAALSAYAGIVEIFHANKEALRKEVAALADLAPGKKGQPNLAEAVQFQSEASIFVAECDAAIGIGQKERDEARGAKAAKAKASGPGDYVDLDPEQHFGEIIAEKTGLDWWSVRKYRKDSYNTGAGNSTGDEWYYKHDHNAIVFTRTPKTKKGTQEALDTSMDKKLKAITDMRTEIQLFASQLSSMTGI